MINMSQIMRGAAGLLALAALCIPPAATAQDRDRDRDGDRDRISRVDAGTVIPIRLDEGIDTDRRDNRIFRGIVERDVRAENGRVVIPRGADAELIVRTAPDNDLILDLEAVRVNGQRYGLRTEPNRVESRRDDNVIGNIIGAISGGQARGQSVRIPRDAVISFRLARPLDVGVEDRGVTRDGRHYHDYYRDDRDRDRDRN